MHEPPPPAKVDTTVNLRAVDARRTSSIVYGRYRAVSELFVTAGDRGGSRSSSARNGSGFSATSRAQRWQSGETFSYFVSKRLIAGSRSSVSNSVSTLPPV